MTTKRDEAMQRLKEVVNDCRYRGPKRDEPMRDSYHWPMNYWEYEAIARAALAVVVADEQGHEEQAGGVGAKKFIDVSYRIM